MKTVIFDTYQDFQKREDKETNGVSPEFARENPNYKKENESNKGCWNCEECEECEECEGCVVCKKCKRCEECEGCKGCEDLKDGFKLRFHKKCHTCGHVNRYYNPTNYSENE